MKKLLFFSVVALFLFAGCKTQQSISSANNDDVYYSRPKHSHSPRKVAQDQDLTAPQALASADTQAMAPSTSGNSSGWYDDYDYSSRIKRFQHPEKNAGYYDESYTNPANYDSTVSYSGSSSPDVNIYINGGYGSYWGSGLSWGMNYGWGSCWDCGWGWGWDNPFYSWYYPYGWYSPYYSWWYPYDYWNGYYNGYWNGYWNGHHEGNWGYAYYGPRRSLTPGIGGPLANGSNLRAVPGQAGSVAPRNERTTPAYSRQAVPTATRSNGNTGKTTPRVAPGQERYQYSRPAERQGSNYQRTNKEYAQKQKASPRYVRPAYNNPASRTSETQVYSSPSYRQPKSSQEYLTPRSQGTVRTQTGTSGQRQGYSTPSGSGTRYAQPSNNNTRSYSTPGTTRSYSQPSRSYSQPSRTYSTPSRTISPGYSSPSRSGGSYSAPSRSGGSSYSAPSRSGGSSYSAPSRSSGSSGSSGSSSSSGRRR